MSSNYPHQSPNPNQPGNQIIKAFIAGALVVIAICCIVTMTVFLTDRNDQPDTGSDPVINQDFHTGDQPPVTTQAPRNDANIPTATPAPQPPSAPAPQGSATGYSVETEVAKIRNLYYDTQNNLNSYRKSTSGSNVYYYNKSNQLVRMDVGKSSSIPYHKQYYFNNGNLYFAFIFEGKTENRLYFKDNTLIRLIDEYGVKTDNDRSNQAYVYWETNVLNEVSNYY